MAEKLPTKVLIAAEQPPVPTVLEPNPDSPLTVTASEPLPVVVQAPDTPLTVTATDAAPVAVTATVPLPVIVQDPKAPPPRPDVVKGEGATLAPTTTEQQDLNTSREQDHQDRALERQQEVNILWEKTQSWIALLVVVAGVAVNSVIITMVVFLNREVTTTQLSLISISLQFINLTAGIIIGFYFSRTNHQARGGVGPKPVEDYQGR